MKLELIHQGKTLPVHRHNNELFAEAPFEGDYVVRLTNDSPRRRLAVPTVDSVNVISGEEGDVDGSGYVIPPWQSLDILGWRRSDSKVAHFRFAGIEGSYSAQMGKGTDNVGVIGVAIFDEKIKRQVRNRVLKGTGGQLYSNHNADWCGGMRSKTTFTPCSSGDERGIGHGAISMDCGFSSEPATAGMPAHEGDQCADDSVNRSMDMSCPMDIGTAYGKEAVMHTVTTTFKKASKSPVLVLKLRYATREKLVEWGVPLAPISPDPFPASAESVPAPPNWQG
jgi:hypothetical protein